MWRPISINNDPALRGDFYPIAVAPDSRIRFKVAFMIALKVRIIPEIDGMEGMGCVMTISPTSSISVYHLAVSLQLQPNALHWISPE